MKTAPWIWLVAGVVLCAGCGNTTAITEVRRDGSFRRTVKLVVPAQSLGPTLPLEQQFALPMGSPWTATRSRDKEQNIVFTSSRDVAAGSQLAGDLTILKAGKPFLSTRTRVVRRQDGLLEYRERISYVGGEKLDIDKGVADLAKAIRGALPAGKATDAELEKIADSLVHDLWRAFFGPGDPLITRLISHPVLLEKRFRQQVGASADRAAREVLRGKLSDEERQAFVRRLALSQEYDEKGLFDPEKEADKQNTQGQGSPELISMLFVAKLPGKVVSTNGDYDPIADEILWTMFPAGAQLGPVELIAVCKP